MQRDRDKDEVRLSVIAHLGGWRGGGVQALVCAGSGGPVVYISLLCCPLRREGLHLPQALTTPPELPTSDEMKLYQ